MAISASVNANSVSFRSYGQVSPHHQEKPESLHRDRGGDESVPGSAIGQQRDRGKCEKPPRNQE